MKEEARVELEYVCMNFPSKGLLNLKALAWLSENYGGPNGEEGFKIISVPRLVVSIVCSFEICFLGIS